jgi:hypothetical protein
MAKQQPKPAQKEATRPKPKAKPAPQGPSFFKFLWDKEQRIDWAIIAGLFVAILAFLKIYYPYPQTLSDTGNYVLSATSGKINGYRPYGYSGFLSFFHGLSTDVTFVVDWQWFMTFLSVGFFLFTVKFIFRDLPRLAFYTLCVICIFNPSIIFMDSYIMSDSLFVSLTLLFLTTCIWIIYDGSLTAIVANLLLLWWCMDTRYIGLFYPLFSAGALVWALWKRFKWMSLAAGLLPLLMLFFYRSSTTDKMKEEFGVETFSSFGGWQKANNGVAVLPYVKVDSTEITDPQVKAIYEIVRQFPDSCFNTANVMATNFMWVREYPGKQCLFRYIQQTGTPYMKAWAYMGTQMDAYGDFLETHYRSEFIKHFIIPNIKNIFEVYEIMDLQDSVSYAGMRDFFTYDRETYHYRTHIFRSFTGIRKIGDGLAWLAFFLSVIGGLVMQKKLNWTREQKMITAGLVLFIGAFCGASTIAAPINNFRYMMPIFYAQILVSVLVISGILVAVRKTDDESLNQQEAKLIIRN